MPGGKYMHRAMELQTRGRDLNGSGMQNEENDPVMAAVEAAREYAHQRLTEINRAIL